MNRRADWAAHAARAATAATAATTPLPVVRRATEPGPGAGVVSEPAVGRLSFAVYGLPAPQGSKRVIGHAKPKPGRAVGRAILVESSVRVKPWREAVKWAARAALPADWQPLDGPLAVRMVFTLPKPASAPKRRRTWPDRMPDLSKLVRATEDALTDAGLWVDDARVVACTAGKVFPGEGADALASPGCWIEVWTIGGDGDAPVG